MLRQVKNFPEKREILEVIARKPTERENVQVRTARQEDDEQNAKRITRHHVTRENKATRKRIKLAAVMHSLPESKRNADKVAQEKRRHAKEQRNRETAYNHVPDRESVRVAFPEVQVQHVPKPREVAFPRGLVKTKVCLDLRNLVRRKRLGGIYATLHRSGLLRTRNQLFHRASRQELNQDKAHQ